MMNYSAAFPTQKLPGVWAGHCCQFGIGDFNWAFIRRMAGMRQRRANPCLFVVKTRR